MSARRATASHASEMTHREILLVLTGLMSGMFLAALDQSIVATAMRTIADDLSGLSLQAWVTTAYLITSTIATPIYGKLGDIFGRRRLFMIAISIFIAGSLLSGLASSMWQLAAFRAVQGLGGGGLFSLALTVVADIVPPRERARYQGMFLAVFGTSSVFGPVIGGMFASADTLAGTDGWRWVFLINVPIGIAAMAMVYRFLHVPQVRKDHRIDWLGAVSITAAVVPLLLVAENGNTWGWTSRNALVSYLAIVIGLAAFIASERAAGDEAIIPLTLFRSRMFSQAVLLSAIVGLGMFGGMMTIPLLLQIVNGATPTSSGLQMMPLVLGMMITSIVSGQVTRKTGHYRFFLSTGTATLLAGYLYMTRYTVDMPYWQTAVGMLLMGLGLGQLMQTLTLLTQQAVPSSEVGVATAAATFFRQIGGTLGVAVFISLLFNNLGSSIRTALLNPDTRAGMLAAAKDPAVLADPANQAFLAQTAPGRGTGLTDMLKNDSSFLTGLDPRLARPFLVGFADSATVVFSWAALAVAVAFLLSLLVKAPALDDTRLAPEGAAAGH